MAPLSLPGPRGPGTKLELERPPAANGGGPQGDCDRGGWAHASTLHAGRSRPGRSLVYSHRARSTNPHLAAQHYRSTCLAILKDPLYSNVQTQYATVCDAASRTQRCGSMILSSDKCEVVLVYRPFASSLGIGYVRVP